MPEFIAPPCLESLKILYADDDLAVVDKPSGLLSVPARNPRNADSLIARLKQNHAYVEAVNRLDMSTSGIMLVAFNRQTRAALGKALENRQVHKSYSAITFGAPRKAHFSIELPIICNWQQRPRQMVSFEFGKSAHTEVKLIASKMLGTNRLAMLELTPHTGRSHQLRLHLAALGMPILGCEFYAHSLAYQLATRLLLHSQYIGFTHPATGKYLQFLSPSPFANWQHIGKLTATIA